MDYKIDVIFESCLHLPAVTFTDFIREDDWTSLNYWDDIGNRLSILIRDAEHFFKKLYPDGHDYSLSDVNISYVGGFEE